MNIIVIKVHKLKFTKESPVLKRCSIKGQEIVVFGGALTNSLSGVKKLICFESLVSTYHTSLYKLPSSAII